MVDRRQDPNTVMMHFTRLIIEEERNIKESYEKIAQYSRELARVTEDSERKLLPRE